MPKQMPSGFALESTLLCPLSKTTLSFAKALYLASKNCSHVTGTICLDLDQSISLISGKFKIVSAEIGLSADLLKQNLTIRVRAVKNSFYIVLGIGH
jgi:tRNA(Ile)-lysidine synthase